MKALLLNGENYLFKNSWKNVEILGHIDKTELRKENLFQQSEKLKLIIPNLTCIKKLVEQNGLVEFCDYCIEDYVEKKIVVLYGNCHMQNLLELLRKSNNFSHQYYLYEILPIFEIKTPLYFEKEIFKECDVFVHQSIRRENRYGEEFASENIIKGLKKACQVIAVPNVYHIPMCYYPQYVEKIELKRKNGDTVFFRDRVIEEEIKAKKSRRDIVEIYKNSDDLFSYDLIDKMWNVYLDKIRIREIEWDIKISNYLLANKNGVRMYYDPNHPTSNLIKYIATELCIILQVDNDLEDKECFLMDTYEMPIVRSVIDYFGLDYSLNNYEMRRTGTKLCYKKMDISEYVNQYTALMWQDKEHELPFRMASYLRFLMYKGKNIIMNKFLRRKK